MTESTPYEYAVRIAVLEEKHKHEVRIAVLEEKVRGSEAAKELQAKEYERRLQDLNHAHAQAEQRDVTFVSRELYDSGIREVHVKIEALQKIVWTAMGILLAVEIILKIWRG